jgi:hypothetical protein
MQATNTGFQHHDLAIKPIPSEARNLVRRNWVSVLTISSKKDIECQHIPSIENGSASLHLSDRTG